MRFKFTKIRKKKTMKQKSITIYLIIGLVIGLVIGGAAGYVIVNNMHKNNFPQRGNFQIDDATKNQITSFFDSTSDINQINSYCGQNRTYCFYYCRNINPDNEACKSIINSTFTGGRPQ